MFRTIASLVCLFSAASLGTAAAATPAASTAPVAYVYVASYYTAGHKIRVFAYSAAPNGKLTAIHGSPFPDNLGTMAVNGKYLFGDAGVSNGGVNIDSYLMESNGALKYAGATDIQKGSGNSCNIAGELASDHTGSDVYVRVQDAACQGPGIGYESLSIDKSTGLLHSLSTAVMSGYLANVFYPITIAADNKYAYATECNPDTLVEQFYAFKRQSDGSLADIDVSEQFPSGGPSGNYNQCVTAVSGDPTNHLAVDVQYNASSGPTDDRIATYAIDTSNGDLSTKSTYSNMSPTAVVSVNAMRMSPSGKLLAVGGQGGLQIFSFNPAGQAKPLTGLLTTDRINAVYWDNANHLYAYSTYYGKLFVFTVTPTSATQAPDSPYHVSEPQAMIVQTK